MMTTKHTDKNAEKAGDGHIGKGIEGEHITQNKAALGEVSTGPNATMDDVGKGSFEQDAPAVRAAGEANANRDRIVQQGDEVIVHSRAIIDGLTEARGLVLKVLDTGDQIAVRIQRSNGQTHDITQVNNRDMGDGSPWFEFPAEETIKKSMAATDKKA